MAQSFKLTRRYARWAFPFFVSAVALFFSIAPAAFAVAVDQTINSSNPGSGTFYNTTGGQTTFNGGNTLNINAGTTLRGFNVNGKDGGNFVLNGKITNIHGAVDVSAFYGANGFEGNGGSVKINAQTVFINGMVKADGINGGLISIPNAGTVNVGPNAVLSATGVGGNAGQVMIKGADGVSLAAGSIVQANGKPVTGLTNVAIAGNIVNVDGIVRANGVVSHGGKISIVANGTTANSNLTIGQDGKVQANGACGDCAKPDGGNGGEVLLASNCGSVINNGIVEAKGGNGFGSKVDPHTGILHEVPGNGGHGGLVSMTYRNRLDTKVGHVDVSGGHVGTGAVNCAIKTANPGNGGQVFITGKDANTLDTSKVALGGGQAGFPTVVKTGQPGTLTVNPTEPPCAGNCGGEPPVVVPPPVGGPPVVGNPPAVPPVPPTRSPIRRFVSTFPFFLGPNAGLDLARRQPDYRLNRIPPVVIVNRVPPVPNAVVANKPVPPPVNFVAQPVVPPVAPPPPPAPKPKFIRGYW
jgi:hypothetical protein